MNCGRKKSDQSAATIIRGDSEDINFIDEDAYAKAVSEWDRIEALPILAIPHQEIDQSPERIAVSPVTSRSSATSDGLQKLSIRTSSLKSISDYVDSLQLTSELQRIHCHADRNRLVHFVRKFLFIGYQSMKRNLKPERNRIFALALKPFDNSDPMHFRMLTSIFHTLRPNAATSCARIGSHWEAIGFQGSDPASDLRGVGLLGLFQLASFVMSEQTRRLAKDIYSLSSTNSSHFPFCIMGLNITQIALQHMRNGVLNSEINKRGSPVFATFNLFYASLFQKLFNLWRDQELTIFDAMTVLQKLREEVKSVSKSISEVLAYTGEEKNAESDAVVIFSDIGDIMNPSLKGDHELDENLI